nr:hypothetical protein CDL12_22225 [Ipomoea trifida]
MSARSGLGIVIRAPLLKLCVIVSSALLIDLCMQRILLCCALKQITAVFDQTVSMRLRPRRTCSGGECFGGFHIKRLLHTFLISKRPLS